MRQITVERGSGRHRVVLAATVTQKGIICALVGGEEPHLGAVVLSVPRPSLSHPENTSCTSSILPLVGHKDDEAARPLAELLARSTGCPVSVSAGLHVDSAGPGDIDILKKNAFDCGKELLELIKDHMG
ncbi:MAG TPA: hypothetical protein DEF36_11200 [Desulfotomaculum sp.]|nr:hypothetical protein [Desulfotomaculum sp.]